MCAYVLYSRDAGSVVVVNTTDYEFEVRGVAGAAPPASLLVWMLEDYDPVRSVVVRHLLAVSEDRYAIKTYRRSSGAVDLVVYRVVEEPAVVPYAKVHISMYRKLNTVVRLPGLALPLVAEQIREIDPRTYDWRVCPPYAGLEPEKYKTSKEILQLVPDYGEVLSDEEDYCGGHIGSDDISSCLRS